MRRSLGSYRISMRDRDPASRQGGNQSHGKRGGRLRGSCSDRDRIGIMNKQNIVVTFDAPPEQKALLLEALGSEASLTFFKELPSAQREQALQEANVLLAWNLPREIPPNAFPLLQQVSFIQLVSAGVDHMPFADLPPHILVASNPGAYAAPMAEHVMAMTLALAKRLLVENQKLRNGEFDQFTPNRLLAGMTAGILGFGGIGRATARLMRA